MRSNGLRRLPDHVVAPLLRAIIMIPHVAEARLLLRRSEWARPPTRDVNDDYNVIWRDETVGRIWRSDYRGHNSGELAKYL